MKSQKPMQKGHLQTERKRISDAETKLSEISVPSWHVLTRADNTESYASIESTIDKVGAIARSFHFFFFLVAALVALTTMTRMVEDERLQIGTMKALGYSRAEINIGNISSTHFRHLFWAAWLALP